MLVDFDKLLKTVSGEILKDEKGKEISLSFVCQEALLANHEEDKGMKGVEKLYRWELAKKCTGKPDLKSEEISKIKELVGRNFTAVIVGPAWELLEGR